MAGFPEEIYNQKCVYKGRLSIVNASMSGDKPSKEEDRMIVRDRRYIKD